MAVAFTLWIGIEDLKILNHNQSFRCSHRIPISQKIRTYHQYRVALSQHDHRTVFFQRHDYALRIIAKVRIGKISIVASQYGCYCKCNLVGIRSFSLLTQTRTKFLCGIN